MRLLFFGSPDFAVPTLRDLSAAGHDIACVVTRPDRPRGRHLTPAPTAVKEAALTLGLHVYQPASANRPEAIEELSGYRADLGVTVAYGEVLRPELLAVAAQGFINVHASLLPGYRGAAPINWVLIRGEETTGVSVIRMSPQLDAGPVLAERRLRIGPEETAGELAERLSVVGADAAAEVVGRLAAGERIAGRPQPARAGFHARKLTKADGRLDWDLPAVDIANRTRGLSPWPGACSHFCGEAGRRRVKLLRVRAEPAPAGGSQPGAVLAANEDGIIVQAGDGVVRILELTPAGGRSMNTADFVHGHRVRPGDRFV